MAIGEELECGVPPAEQAWGWVAHSDHGTSFFKIETIGKRKGTRNLQPKRVALNWSLAGTSYLLDLIRMSITNIKSAIKIINGDNAESNVFVRPIDDDDFLKPWKYSLDESYCFKNDIDEAHIGYASKKELLQLLKRPN